MPTFNHRNIANAVHYYFNITAIEDEIVLLTGYRGRSFCITDSKSKKKYILQIKTRNHFETPHMIDIADQIIEKAYEFSSKNEHFSTPKIIKTFDGQLSASIIKYSGPNSVSGTNVKLFEFIPSETVPDTINNSIAFSKLDAQENLYRGLGFFCANISHFLETQSTYLDWLASIRNDILSKLLGNPQDTPVSEFANHVYPDKTHPRRIIIESIFKQFTEKKRKLDSLPKRVLQRNLSPNSILFNSEKSHLDPNGNHDFKKLHFNFVDFHGTYTGPQCIELAILILTCIDHKNRFHHVVFDTMVNVPKLIIQGFKSHPSTTEFFRSGQLELLPSVIMYLLCSFVLISELPKPHGRPRVYRPLKVEHRWELLNCWYQCFHDNDKLIETWSNSDS